MSFPDPCPDRRIFTSGNCAGITELHVGFSVFMRSSHKAVLRLRHPLAIHVPEIKIWQKKRRVHLCELNRSFADCGGSICIRVESLGSCTCMVREGLAITRWSRRAGGRGRLNSGLMAGVARTKETSPGRLHFSDPAFFGVSGTGRRSNGVVVGLMTRPCKSALPGDDRAPLCGWRWRLQKLSLRSDKPF